MPNVPKDSDSSPEETTPQKKAPQKKAPKPQKAPLLKSTLLATGPARISAPAVAAPRGRRSKAPAREGLLNRNMVSKPFRITPSIEIGIQTYILEEKKKGRSNTFQSIFEEALGDWLEKHGLSDLIDQLKLERIAQE